MHFFSEALVNLPWYGVLVLFGLALYLIDKKYSQGHLVNQHNKTLEEIRQAYESVSTSKIKDIEKAIQEIENAQKNILLMQQELNSLLVEITKMQNQLQARADKTKKKS